MTNYREIQNTEAAIDAFQDYFSREVARPLFPSGPEASDTVETLLNEALINAWEHGNRKDPAKRIFVAWQILGGNGLKVSVRDEGPGFSPPGLNCPQAPPVEQRRGRGLIIMSEFADSVSFNKEGNEITFILQKGEKQVTEKYFQGFLIVLGLDVKEENAREELRVLRDNLVRFTTDFALLEKEKNIYLLVNLAPFNVVSSTFFGDIGATLDVEQIKLVGLCGMRPVVRKIAQRMNVIQPGNGETAPTRNIQDNLHKIRAFENMEEGFKALIAPDS